MKNRKLCRLFAAVLAVAMVAAMIPVSALAGFTGWFSGWKGTVAEEETVETLATGSITQPFASGTQGSTYFRIPAIVTLDDGTIVAAADARWSATTDGGGLDTIVAYSKDNGVTWKSSLANYLGDNGNTHNKASTTFIDPALATDGDTVYMLVDLFPSGYSNTTSATNYVTKTGSGFNSDGKLKLCAAGSSNYNYYLGEFDSDGYAYIYNSNGVAVNNYKVDQWFNLYKSGAEDGNLFYTSSAYHVYTTQYLYLTKSTDGGATWSAPTLINVKEEQECFYGVCPGSGCVTKDGTIIFMCYGCKEIGKNLRASYIYFEDQGKTWKRSWDRDTLTFQNTSSEASVTEVEVNGKTYLYMFTRYYGTPTIQGAYYFSADGGETWTAKTNINYTCGSDMGVITCSKLVNDKPAMLLSAHSSSGRNSGVIYTITVEENGNLTLVNTYSVNGSSYYAYSDLTELSDGSIGLLYESKDGSITFEKIDIRDIVGEDATITEPDTGTTEPEEPTQDATVRDEYNNTGISVTGPGFTSVQVKEVPNVEYEGAEVVKAYDIIPYVGDTEYHGNATVTFPLPADWDATRVKGFVQESSGTYNWDLNATVSGDTVSVEFPHFSVGGIYLAAEAGTGDGDVTVEPTETVNVTLTVGETQTITDDTGNYEASYTDAGLDKSIATVQVNDTPVDGGTTETKLTSVSNGDSFYIRNASGQYLNASAQWVDSADNAVQWTLEVTSYGWTRNYLKNGSNYLRYNNGDITTTTSTYYGTSWTVSDGSFSYSSYTLGDAYSVTKTDPMDATTIQITGVSAGTTSVVVGNTQYNITVNKLTAALNVRPGYTVTLGNAGKTITEQPDSQYATAELASNGTLTITGVVEGSTTMETDLYKITITVADIIEVIDPALSPFVGGTTNATNGSSTVMASRYEKLTKITMNVGLTFDVDLKADFEGESVLWSVADPAIATVDEEGKVTALTPGETELIATVGNTSYRIPLVVVANSEHADLNSGHIFHFYLKSIGNTRVYYSTYCTTALTEAIEGEVLYLTANAISNAANEMCIDFFAAPDEGYALTSIVQSLPKADGTESTSSPTYYRLANDNGELDLTSTDAYYNGSASTAPRRKTNYGTAATQAMMQAAVDVGCDATNGYTNNNWTGLSAQLSYHSDRLPTIAKEIISVGGQTYEPGMTAKVGDVIVFRITVTQYQCVNAITYTNPVLTERLANATFTGNTTTTNPGLSNAVVESDTTKTFDVTYTVTDKDLDTTITNKVDLTYTYKSTYSVGSYAGSAKAEAKIVATKFIPNSIIVDFGLPVECDFSQDAHDSGITFDTTSGTASYGDVKIDGYKVTYTPTAALLTQGYDTVSFKNTKANAATYSFKVIPASNVLYEENFLTEVETNGQSWTTVGAEFKNNQTATKTAESDLYGFDTSYGANNENRYLKVTGLTSDKAGNRLTVDFSGNGFDLIGSCAEDTGRVMLIIQDADKKPVKAVSVDTRCSTSFDKVPLAHIMLEESGNYTASVITYYAKPVTATAANSVSVQSMRAARNDSYDLVKRDLAEFGLTLADVEFITLSDTLSASAQRLNAVATYADANSSERKAGTHVEIDGFRIYRETTDANYVATEKDLTYERVLDFVEGSFIAYTENGTVTEVTGYDSDTVGGPKNEIYLEKSTGESGHAVTFRVGNLDTIQVSLRSVDGKPVTVSGNTINSTTEMYYEITGTDGVFTIVNTGDGILGIGNLKLPVDATIQAASELEPEVVSYSLRMALAVEPDQPEEPEQPEVFLPQSFNASCRSVNVLRNKLVTVSVTASTDVAYITVNGQKVNAWNNALGWIYQPDTLRFTFTDLIKRGESKTYEIVAYNADGVASAVYTVQG